MKHPSTLIEKGKKLDKAVATIARQVQTISELKEALEEISLGNGAYDTDNLKHASNCIENMKSIANKTLKNLSK